MKYAFVLLAAAAGLVAAQTRDDIPKCAIPCLDDAIKENTDCSVDDTKCVCAAFDKIQGPATSCVIKACGAEVAVGEVLPATQALCANGGGDEEPASSSAAAPAPSSSAAEEPAPSSSAAASSSVIASTSVTLVPTLAPSSTIVSVTVPVTPSSAPSSAPPATTPGAPSTTPGVPPPTGAAAGMGSVGALAMLALGALAL